MKKTLFAILLSGCCTSFSQAIDLVGNYSFQENLNNAVTGENALNKWTQNNCTTSFDNGYLTFTERKDTYSGLYNVDASDLGSNWSLQLSINLAEIGGSYQQILKLGSDAQSAPGLMLVVGNGASDWGSGFGLASAKNHDNRIMSTQSVNAGKWNTISLISLNNSLKMYIGTEDITNTLTLSQGSGIADLSYSLDALKLGYNNITGNYGVKEGTSFKDLKIWALDATTDTFASVEAAMQIPEPTTTCLSIIGLIGLIFHRRRA